MGNNENNLIPIIEYIINQKTAILLSITLNSLNNDPLIQFNSLDKNPTKYHIQ
jgi:hypothetical protein